MNTHQLLETHPSVQALNIATNMVNATKAAHHSRVINSRPFTTASAVLRAHKGGRKQEKGTPITVERHDQNIRAAAVAAAAAARQTKSGGTGGGFSVSATTKMAASRGGAPPNDLPPLPEGLPPISPAKPNRPGSAAVTGGAKKPKSRLASLVASQASSFEPSSSHPDSYSDYSCSCCHPQRAPSSRVSVSSGIATSHTTTLAPSAVTTNSVPLSAYDNMSSISERIAKQQQEATAAAAKRRGASASSSSVAPSGGPETKRARPAPSSQGAPSSLTGSMTSTKLLALEKELLEERRHRQTTERELSEIKERQEQLLRKFHDTNQSGAAGGVTM